MVFAVEYKRQQLLGGSVSQPNHNSKDRAGGGACIPEFQTRPSPLSNLQGQCFSLRNKYSVDRLADEPDTFVTHSGMHGKEK